jgi:CheY-like chemotaxis protein
MVSFSDDGCGMDREIQARIFEPFFTTKPKGEGTGLGLSTVFGIVKQNSGLVNVYSEPGQGTTLRIYLPAYEGGDDEMVMDIVDQCPKGTETLLVVEDEKKILKFCKQFLSDLGYRVISFSAPEKAVRYLEKNTWPIDLLISDVVMPGMNGEELRKHVETLRPGVKCLFMSGYTHNVMVQRGVFPETIELMQKPFSIVELANRVRRALDS